MNGSVLKKFVCLVIVVLFLFSTCTSLSGSSINKMDTELAVNTPETNLQDHEAVVSCSTYGLGQEDVEQKSTMTRVEASLLLDMINAYAVVIAQDPHSTDATDLQQEIITLASEYGLVPRDTLSQIHRMRVPRKPLLPQISLGPMSKASEWFCNYAAGGEGGASPVIILPRLIPILLTPIPRIYYRWNCKIGFSSVGGLRSGTGFYATGEQSGTALGFWGIGFSIFLPPVQAFGIIGYALHCSVEAEHLQMWPPNYPPEVNAVFPLDEAVNIPISTSELSFYIDDYENELMSYSVITNPDIGTGNGNLKPDGTYTVPISGLEGSESYTWTVQVSDGPNTVEDTFGFSTEQVAPIVSSPNPEDGAYLVPIDLSELRFHLRDLQGDLMDYTVETVPDIGSGSGTDVNDGFFTVSVSGLEHLRIYKWYVNATDGTHWKHKVFSFQTEMIMEFNPFDEGWQYRKNITIDHTQVSGDLEDFPVLISITDTDLRDKAQADGDDILFMDGTGTATRLFYEIEHYDGSTGDLIAWVKLSQVLEVTDTELCIYYGNPTCDDQQFPIYVWDDNYEAVWHMTDEHDSTANANDLTNYGATAGESGQIYQCYRFDGVDDYMMFPDIIGSGKPLTIEIWGTIIGTNAANDDYQSLFGLLHEKHIHVTFYRVHHEKVPPMSMYTVYRDTSQTHYLDSGENSVTYGIMNSVVSRIDEFGTAQIILNGVGKESVTGVGSIDNDNRKNVLGAWSEKSGIFSSFSNSYIDEVRVSQTARNDDWILTEYNNQNYPNMFYTIGPEEPGP